MNNLLAQVITLLEPDTEMYFEQISSFGPTNFPFNNFCPCPASFQHQPYCCPAKLSGILSKMSFTFQEMLTLSWKETSL